MNDKTPPQQKIHAKCELLPNELYRNRPNGIFMVTAMNEVIKLTHFTDLHSTFLKTVAENTEL